jgi:predicted ATP-dependent protease
VDGLRVLAGLAGRSTPHHLELTVPARVGWARSAAELLRELTTDQLPVVLADRPDARSLRGGTEAGLCQRADGGILVVDAADLQANDGAWPALQEAMSLATVTPAGKSDDPEPPAPPRPARLSALVVGTEATLKKLRETHAGAAPLLARRLDVASDVPRDRSGVAVVAALLRRHVLDHDLGDVTEGALRWLVEALAAGARRDRLPLWLDSACQALSEARLAHPAGSLGAPRVATAWARMRERRSGREELHRARIAAGIVLVRTEGQLIGVVNGLMVYGQARQAYAIPGRITARVAVGREGLINVERESKYSGRSFDKGVYQLAGLLRGLFATRSPLGLAASLVFEQSYGRVDGDSASLAEALALFSCLSDLGCRQDVAVSGAINQRGEVLPIGSGNLKVEGWWRTCRDRGLTGTQGVVLPAASVPDLQLSGELLEDLRQGRFSLWSATSLEEAIEVVLGRPAGLRPGKAFAQGSVYARAARRMMQMSERLHPPRPKPKPKPKPAPANDEVPAQTAE